MKVIVLEKLTYGYGFNYLKSWRKNMIGSRPHHNFGQVKIDASFKNIVDTFGVEVVELLLKSGLDCIYFTQKTI
jgi:hypothetical protein